MFRISIEGIADNKLGELVSHIGTKKYSVKVTHYLHPDQEDVKINKGRRKHSRVSPNAPLMLTAKAAQKGTIREKALERFKKLEVKHGAGGVTRRMFRAELNKLDCDKSTLTSLVTSGFLRHVEV